MTGGMYNLLDARPEKGVKPGLSLLSVATSECLVVKPPPSYSVS